MCGESNTRSAKCQIVYLFCSIPAIYQLKIRISMTGQCGWSEDKINLSAVFGDKKLQKIVS